MDVEIGNEAVVPVGGNTTEERVATVTAVDPSALTPSAMRGLRDIGSQVCSILDLYSFRNEKLPVCLQQFIATLSQI